MSGQTKLEETIHSIADGIMKVVKTCQKYGCNKVFVSAITFRPNFPNEVSKLNNILESWQVTHDFKLIYNNNIDATCISRDRRHLNNKGKNILSSNFVNILNKLYN